MTCVPLLRFFLHRIVYKPFGTYILAETDQQRRTALLPPKVDHKRKKLTESLWKVSAYTALMSLGVVALHDKHWATHSAHWWIGYPDQPLDLGVEVYYTAELAFYGASMIMLLFWEERRHDFPVMMTHHVVTICLISFSYITKYTRIGSVVMLLHDPSDIFLEAAKISQYLGHEATANVFFVLLLVTWMTTRLFLLPFWLINSALFELPLVLGHHPPYSLLFAGLLCTLVCMHVYWFVLLARIAIMTAVTGRAKDTREDED